MTGPAARPLSVPQIHIYLLFHRTKKKENHKSTTHRPSRAVAAANRIALHNHAVNKYNISSASLSIGKQRRCGAILCNFIVHNEFYLFFWQKQRHMHLHTNIIYCQYNRPILTIAASYALYIYRTYIFHHHKPQHHNHPQTAPIR